MDRWMNQGQGDLDPALLESRKSDRDETPLLLLLLTLPLTLIPPPQLLLVLLLLLFSLLLFFYALTCLSSPLSCTFSSTSSLL